MNKDKLSFADVEQLLTELALHDLQAAQDDAQTELMRGAARGEIRRVFFRRRCLRVAGSTAMLAVLGGAASLMLPEDGPEPRALATALPTKHKNHAAVQKHSKAPAAALPEEVPVSYRVQQENGADACELVIYSVPL